MDADGEAARIKIVFSSAPDPKGKPVQGTIRYTPLERGDAPVWNEKGGDLVPSERAQILRSALRASRLLAGASELLPAILAFCVVFIGIKDVDLHGSACGTGHGVHLPARDDIPWQDMKLAPPSAVAGF
jgi:hypothetical protein